jgi:uncharacterized protein
LNDRPLVLYHAQCRDGQGAAWVAKRAMPKAELVPVQHGGLPPYDLVRGRGVYVIDFSWRRAEMKTLILHSRSTVVLDHHQTAQTELAGILEELRQIDQRPPGDAIVFDMERSGAGIAWDYFHPTEPRPWVVNYVEDRDLWRFALPSSQEINGYLATKDYTPEAFDSLPDIDSVKALGKGALAAVRSYADAVCSHAFPITVGPWVVPSVTACQYAISEVLEQLMDVQPAAPFVVGWWRRADGLFQYSLRSRGEFDVSTVAMGYGGGGHRNAAGFQLEVLIA